MTSFLGTDDNGDDGEFTELVDADFGRIDLVKNGANGMPFLIAKSADGAAGLLPPDLVRGLLGDGRGAVAKTKERDDVTITGSPAAVMKMIHEAAVRAVSPNDGREKPMTDTTPDNAPAAVVKADGPDLEVGDVVGDAPGGSTAETVPGSPAWESLDAETATNVIGVLARVKAALEWLSDREATEAVTGDGGDALASMDLADAAVQVDCLIRQLAGFAATEQLEGETAVEVDDVTKAAVAGLDVAAVTEAVGVVERFGPVVKAGRVLSAANEAAIRSASESLQKVLASLPAAPVADDTVTKETAVATETETVAPADGVAKEAVEHPADGTMSPPVVNDPVEKAKGDPLMAVYDENGRLVGTIDPKDLSPIAKPQAGGGEKPAEAAPAGEDDLTPAPAADQGTPAEAASAPAPAPAAPAAAPAAEPEKKEPAPVAKSDDESVVLKGIIDSAVAAALKDHLAVVDVLKAEIEHLKAPAPSKVLTNGQLPPAHQMRGQDRGAPQVDVAKADDLRARLAAATTVAEREAIQKEMNADAAAVFDALRADAQTRRVR